ncbi:trehalose-phosphatase [Vallicoccus soli]|uniref:Trehalose 6-phosphate phosphatase n=1 Tax=Vallicoccus soli TaxID=2339232 RepID=A0A3A3Z2Y4_9ACTN|nr:trehalose-phosphatase [Vallicoccus soli]RJK97772.1 trehalose-phosphatase [Vallicoccus soli]
MSTLPVPVTEAGRTALAALAAAPAQALVACDYDGTLAPIVDDPAAARADAGVAGALADLGAVLGRVAVVTGRPAAVAVELGGLADVPGLVVLGHYGLERWHGGELSAPDPAPGVVAARAELPGLLGGLGADGARVEDKRAAVAVHTRGAAAPQELLERLRAPLGDLAARHGLVVEPGRLVLELRPPGVDKGAALRSLVEAPPFDGRPSCVVFCGDDLGDLPAFDAVDALRAQGVPGLLVASGSDEVRALAERADLVVDGPPGVLQVLRALLP